jgi:hypothetical protein
MEDKDCAESRNDEIKNIVGRMTKKSLKFRSSESTIGIHEIIGDEEKKTLR